MRVLQIARHERFAQALADGMSATRAYVAAGYSSGNRGAASRLQRRDHIKQRVREVLQVRVDAAADAAATVKATLTLDKQWVLDRLMRIVERCLQDVPVLGKLGHPTGFYVFDSKGANRALELLGKHLGLFSADEKTPAELSALLAALAGGNGSSERRVYDA